MKFFKWYPIPEHARHGEKQKEKTLIPGPVEKLIPVQHCFKPAPAAIRNVPWSLLTTSQIFSKCDTKS
jgi:hypothetical protein